jgi:hypothetical protein
MLRLCLALSLALAVGGCKKKPSYDLGSPEATLASFEKALDSGRIPEDLATFVSSPREVAAWKLRCRTRGCVAGTFKIVKQEHVADYTAVLLADYRVEGKDGGIVMRGKSSPIHFAREEGRWYIEQFGEYVTAPRTRRPAPNARDAAPEQSDAGAPGAGTAPVETE